MAIKMKQKDKVEVGIVSLLLLLGLESRAISLSIERMNGPVAWTETRILILVLLGK